MSYGFTAACASRGEVGTEVEIDYKETSIDGGFLVDRSASKEAGSESCDDPILEGSCNEPITELSSPSLKKTMAST